MSDAAGWAYGTRYPELFAALAAPFEPWEVKSRNQGGRELPYITARSAMNRLDEVLGPENWEFELHPFGENAVLARMTIALPGGERVTRCDLGATGRMSAQSGAVDPGDDDKGAASDGLKRVAAHFGVGRYLYGDGVPRFVLDHVHGPGAAELAPRARAQGYGYGGGHGRDEGRERVNRDFPARPPGGDPGQGGAGNAPRSGRALFAWVKQKEDEHGVALLKYLNQWGKLQDLPGRMVDWDALQVKLAYDEACRKLGGGGGEPAAAAAGHADEPY
jgi:hypothetical protein